MEGRVGSWVVGERLPDIVACAAACAECPRCAYISFSKQWNDCSWFHRCNPNVLETKPVKDQPNDFVTVRVKEATKFVKRALEDHRNRTLIVMIHYASNVAVRKSSAGGTVSARDNVRHFIARGILPALQNPNYKFVLANTGPMPLSNEWLPRSPRGTDALEVINFNSSWGFEFVNYKRTLLRLDAIRQFKYFVLLPDSVRGPYLPSYVPPATWPDLLTSMLTPTVKLVGPSINCMYCHHELSMCTQPGGLHVQGYMLATDRVGLAILLRHWRRPHDKSDSIRHNEMGASPAIFSAGYNVAVLQHFWNGHDFLNAKLSEAKCKLITSHATGLGGKKSLGLPTCKGCQWGDADLTPLEVMFAHRSIPGAHAEVYSQMDDELSKLEDGRTR